MSKKPQDIIESKDHKRVPPPFSGGVFDSCIICGRPGCTTCGKGSEHFLGR